MKKIVLLLIGMLGLCACQKTPEDSYVAGKNADEFQKAIQNTAESAEFNGAVENREYQISEYQDSYSGVDSNVRVQIQAQVKTQTGPYMVFRVKPHEFTSEEIKGMADVFFEGETAYEPKIALSKGELEGEILALKQLLGDEEALMEYYENDTTMVEEVKAMYEEELAYYESQYDSAEETIAARETDWVFRPQEYYDYMADLYEADEERLNLAKTQRLIVEAAVDGFDMELNVCNRNEDDFMIHNLYFTVKDGYQKTPLEETEEEAVGIAEKLLADLGLSKWKNATCRAIQKPGDQGENLYYYSMSFIPTYEGLDVTRQRQLSTIKGEDNYAALYYYENLTVEVSNGRVIYMELTSPMDVASVENENIQFLSLAEALSSFQSQMQVEATAQNLAGESAGAKQIEARVDEIELGLVRIKIPDDDKEFYLVPAWTFTGEVGVDTGNGVQFTSEMFTDDRINANDFTVTYQTINAVDGTFINVYRGY